MSEVKRQCPEFKDLPDECISFDMRGRCVNVCHPNTASGYYPASDEAVAAMNENGTNLCPDGVRPGRMVIKGLPASQNSPEGYINTCNAKIDQRDMPDLNIIEWRYRIYVNLALVLLVVIMLGATTIKLFK